ncbi:MAG: beta-ketoacyl-ACP synthase II, partial [Gammaproteobacteria bacterium]|nr:beta-ketoacyl-ACP synthase II [Gammaproteobacteria bacterium]
MKGDRRVVVTGMGMVSPVGNSVDESWENILAGKSGAGPVPHFDATDFPVTFSCSVKPSFDPLTVLTKKDLRKMDSFIHFGMVAGAQAFRDSGLEITEENAARVGVSIGSGIGGLPGIERGRDALVKGGPRKVSPFFVPSNIINMVSGNLSILLGAKGPNTAIVTACSSATHSIGDAAR